MRCAYLGGICSIVHRRVQAATQGPFGVAAAEQLPDLTSELADFGLADLGLWRVQRGSVEVDAGVLVEGINVDCAPGVAQRGASVLLDDGHVGGPGGLVPLFLRFASLS